MAMKTNHYERAGLPETIVSALENSGVNLKHLTIEDLAAVDEIHVRGRKATADLAVRLTPKPASHILDIGSGVGGAARYLADTYGCSVTGLDLTFAYCQTASTLSKHCRLSERTVFIQGDATALPFADATFDCVWTIHTTMNIPDKDRLYAEIHRVLRPGGILAFFDILQGEGGEIHTPVPWAVTAEQSHLLTSSQLGMALDKAGFIISAWEDVTPEGRDWFKRLGNRSDSGPKYPLGAQLLFGDTFREMIKNQTLNLIEGRTVLLEGIALRKDAPT